MTTFIEQARLYVAYHQKPLTKYTHLAGIPLIILSVMIFLGFFQLLIPNVWHTDFAAIGTIAILIYYFLLNWRLALVLTPILIFLLWVSSFFSYAGPTAWGLWAFIITFVLGWALQLGGHYLFEGKRPAFMENLWMALIAPLVLTAELFFMANWMPELKKDIYGEESEPVKPKAKTKSK